MITETKDLSKCYGCFACANICPKNCITLKQDEEGFFMPHVDTQTCINCGVCDKVCIIDKKQKQYLPIHKKPKCIYGYYSNDIQRKKSASGGLSYALSEFIISNGGVVFGVVGKWFEDVHHVKVDSLRGLEAISGSKNIQSRVGEAYREVKKELKRGRQVLFTGTPCQVAALYSYLEKDYENLYTADLVCHGVPSQKVLKSYISQLENEKGQKIVKFGRDETFQYLPVQYIAWFEDGTYQEIMPEDSYYRKGFLSNLFQRKSCAQCKFSKFPRIADVSMGDVMFSVDTPQSELDPHNLGVSLGTVNSIKGETLLTKISPNFVSYPLDTETAATYNRWLSHGIENNKLRQEFFNQYLSKGFSSCEQIIQQSYDDMHKRYALEGKMYRIKLLFKPIVLTKKIIKKLRKMVYVNGTN